MRHHRSSRRRTAVTFLVIAAVVGLFIGKLVDIQVVRANELTDEAAQNQSNSVITYGTRGSIVDRSGTVLADATTRYRLTTSPKNVAEFLREMPDGQEVMVSVEQAASEIGAITGQTVPQIVTAVGDAVAKDPKANYLILSEGLDLEAYQKLVALDIPWTYFETQQGRTYPNGAVAGNLIGYVGGDGAAQEGMEYAENACLAGANGSESYERSADYVRIPGSTVAETPAVDGGTLELTIDADLQYYSQQVLAQRVAEVGGSYGIVVVQEVKTGKLLTVAETPTVDPNNVAASAPDDRSSRAFRAPFEPGSTFKPMTAAMLIDQGLASPTSQVVVPDTFEKDGASFSDDFAHTPTNYTLTGILKDSSNVGIAMMGSKLSASQRYDYLKKFGLGASTAVGFPGESGGLLADSDDWDNQTNYTTMFGQGVSATAVQVASIYQTLGNGGVRLPAQLVEGCTTPDGSVIDVPDSTGTPVVSAGAAKDVVDMLQTHYNEGWLANDIHVDGYNIATKTGTAQQPDGNGGYSKSYTVSLAGLAPAEDPEYVVTVTIADPVKMNTSQATAPVFQQVMTQVLKTNRVEPSTVPPVEYPTTW
ncbi:cell division protein FtsI (penicillin-binding protein 3) [Rathayibacter sp. PhB152]|uniref:peptidoglycan D,D-transpeptidase FtsI family protein n=1 Tax=Rathayibacter sp. PhB152 TaxID=2485190 RepID=UPI000F920030|nr:penicillin-binding protein 2 [Rathayibacter sp. PhB152]ROQ58670.1 cell division protein FtsI (penicillin-binding protein 3) [Rathayibacter sp. PhB152]